MIKKLIFGCMTSGLVLSIPAVAVSQSAVDQIVVTAQKREKLEQDVPIAVTAISENVIESFQINDIEALSDIVPGLQIVSEQPSSNIIAIRGIVGESGPISPVGFYIDETPFSSFAQSMPDFALWDLERVEVLRGPQGTLFGDGSMAGTIRFITNKPNTEEFAGRIQLGGFTYKDGGYGWEMKGLLNIPITDEFAIRGTVSFRDDPGYIDVPELGTTDSNGHELLTGRLSARWTPTDRFTADFSWFHQDLEQGFNNRGTSPGVFDPVGSLPPKSVVPISRKGMREQKYDLLNLTLQYEFDYFTVVSATSRYDQSGSFFEDLSTFVAPFFFPGAVLAGVPVADFLPNSSAASVATNQTAEQFTQEIRLVSSGDNWLDWTVGAFYKDDDRSEVGGFEFIINADVGLLGPPPNMVTGMTVPLANELGLTANSMHSKSWAVFSELDFQLLETVNLNIGARYYSDTRDSSEVALADSVIFGRPEGTVLPGTGKDSTFAPKVSLRWSPTDNYSFFASAGKGFRSGGTNENHSFAPDVIPQDFNAETLWSYEIGMKSTPASWLRANFYVYYNDWTNLQLFFATPDGLFGYLDNAGAAEGKGAELELIAQPTDRLTIFTGVSYIDVEIAESVTTPGSAVEIASKGNEIPFIPPWTYSLSLDYIHPIASTLNLHANASWTYRGRAYSDAANSLNQYNERYGQLSGRLGIEGEQWGVYVFGRNLTNEDDTTFIQQPISLLTDIVFKTFVPPRTIGLEVTARF